MAERSPAGRALRRWVGYPLEALAALIAYGAFKLLPVDLASALGGAIGRAAGPLLPAHGRALRHLRAAMPDLSAEEAHRILGGMWDNLGRVAGEYPHLDAITRDAGRPGARVAVAGMEHVERLRAEDGAAILFSGHLANWEVFARTLRRLGLPYAQVYRAPNNPFVERMAHSARGLEAADIVPKGAAGARKAIEVLRAGRRIGMLVDQKMNDGIAVPFFGRQAMTPPALAQLALRFHCPVVPVRMERLDRCRFRVSFDAPITFAGSGDRTADAVAAMTRVNAMLETWIRERPDQWLWPHRRWPEDQGLG